ncbi:hypothetical protein JT55_15035 [Rhodovulum sp. NI22]|nr:hypothetical protein JT55_15035 [Rhodovulum sp. NI22]
MPHTATLSQFRNAMSRYVARVAWTGKRLILMKHGKAVAGLVTVRDLELLDEVEAKSLDYKRYQTAEKLMRWEALKAGIAEGE